MSAPRLLLVPLLVAAMFVTASSGDHALAMKAEQNRTARGKRVPVIYVCPMHADVTSQSRSKCPKCKMSLVKKRAAKTVAAIRSLR